ncbi:MAG: prolyl oligopeptidase family serine peptidase [bacterium]|nr:prolyl oligopeptidase family serine peptidase [bacterium]
MWCERGAFVLKTNYHGSSNYGINFGESIAGHYYEYEVPDIEAGVDMLIAEGKVDKDKMGVLGHSNGAIDVNWTSDYGNHYSTKLHKKAKKQGSVSLNW